MNDDQRREALAYVGRLVGLATDSTRPATADPLELAKVLSLAVIAAELRDLRLLREEEVVR